MSLKPCKFYIGDSKKALTYDEMRQHLIDNYADLVQGQGIAAVVEKKKSAAPKETKIEQKPESKETLKGLKKPDVSIASVSNSEIVNSADPIGNKKKLEDITRRQKELDRLINCLWA